MYNSFRKVLKINFIKQIEMLPNTLQIKPSHARKWIRIKEIQREPSLGEHRQTWAQQSSNVLYLGLHV